MKLVGRQRLLVGILALVLFVLLGPAQGWCQALPPAPPQQPAAPGGPFGLNLTGPGSLVSPERLSGSIQLLALITVLSLAPALLMMLTSFVRIAVVLGFVRRAMGAQEVPPTQVLLGLSLFLTFFVMTPTFQQVNNQALQPYLAGRLTPSEAYELGIEPVRDFLFAHTRKAELALFVRLSRMERPEGREDIPNHVLVPAFMISELKTAFIIGFIIYIPFLIIDMVVASILLSMGMMMLPPVIISLPFKVLLFVLVDGWTLVIGSLMQSFN